MKIDRVIKHSEKELFDKLRQVYLEGQPEIKVYQGCSMEIFKIDPYEVTPAQYYVLIDNLKRLKELRHSMMDQHGHDILQLDGYLSFWPEDGDRIDIFPPIIEREGTDIKEMDYDYNIVCDGIHRLYLSQLECASPLTVWIDYPSKPYYAYPISGHSPWDKVQIITGDFPDGFLKRWPRMENKEESRKLFRDFDSVFNTQHERRR